MRRFIAAVVLSTVAIGFTASSAQQTSTLVLRSGELINGDLIDLGAGGFTVRVNGQSREIPKGEVVTVDFGGGNIPVPDAAKQLSAGSSLIVLRNGETLAGEFYDISGTQPLRLTFRTAGGERVFQSNDVHLIYVQRMPGGSESATVAPGVTNGNSVSVSARTQWTSTGITVTQGQQLRFESTGEIVFSPKGHVARPAGSVDGLTDSNAPVRNGPQGALIGRVGGAARGRGAAGATFLIGDQTTVTMPASGTLFLGVNDSGLDDNRGNFSVRIGQ